MTFSQDRDLVILEPRLFAELAWPGQVLAAGSDGALADGAFTSASADFVAARLAVGMVLHVQLPAGATALEIVAIDSASELTVSALRATADDDAIVPAAEGETLSYHVASFAAQAEMVALEMLTSLGLWPADPTSPWQAQDIAQPEALRAVSAYGVLATVLGGAASRTDAQDGYWTKAAHYRRLFERGLQRLRVALGGEGGSAQAVRDLGAGRLRRD